MRIGMSDGDEVNREESLILNDQEQSFHIISPEKDDSLPEDNSNSCCASNDKGHDGIIRHPFSHEEEDVDDAFFAKSFAFNAEQREVERLSEVFAGGLRSLFDAEAEDGHLDSEIIEEEQDANNVFSLNQEIETERRESLDGVLRQNDADFLTDSGRKYESLKYSTRTTVDVEIVSDSEEVGENCIEGVPDNWGKLSQQVRICPESILEAMLFVGNRENKPLSLKSACRLMRNVSELEALEALADLNERYYRECAPYKIIRDGNGYRMVLRSEFVEWVSRNNGRTKEFKLSQTSIDVLALIAYRQPVSLEEILEIRNNAIGILTQLVKRELIVAEKQTVDKKKRIFYKTTDRFLKLFNLGSLDDLPIVGDVDYR